MASKVKKSRQRIFDSEKYSDAIVNDVVAGEIFQCLTWDPDDVDTSW